MKHFLFGTLGLLMLVSCSQNTTHQGMQTQCQKQAEGVWQVSAGKPDKLNLLSELTIQPKLETINKMVEAKLQIALEYITFETNN